MSPITHLIAGVPVTDLDAGIDWYTRFFGRPPDLRVGNEVLWDIDEHATLFIEPNAAQAGAGRITLAVTGLDALLEHLAAERIEHEPIETYSNGVRHVKIPDPDGNAIAFAELSDAASDRAPALEPFDALIGTWATEATHPLFDGVVPGSSTFEWLEGGRFLIQRSRNDHELFPDAVSVIGAPEAGEGLVMEYFDSRGVRRTYGVSIDDDELRIWRDHPGFEQRFSATLGHDSFEGLWQLAETAGDWRDDLKVTYRRRD